MAIIFCAAKSIWRMVSPAVLRRDRGAHLFRGIETRNLNRSKSADALWAHLLLISVIKEQL